MNFFSPTKNKNIFFIAIIILILMIITKNQALSSNDASRMATIESLVNRHTFIIDDSPYKTVDQIFRDNHFYSSKPPLLSTIGAGLFWFLKNIFNLSLPGADIPSLAVYILTLIVTGGNFLVLLIFFFKSLKWINLDEKTKYILTTLLGLGTYIFSYAGVFNNHIPTATMSFLAFYYLLKIKFTQKNLIKNIFLCGFFLGLAGVFDLASTTILWIGFYFIYFAKTLRYNKNALFYLISGFCVPILAHIILNFQITGDIFPAFLHKNWYHYPGSEWNNPQPDPNKLIYIFNLIFGTHGVFLYSPILLFPAWKIIKIIKNKSHDFYNESILVSAITISSIILITIITSNYGGYSYANRWFIAFIPLVFYFIAFYFNENKKTPWFFKIAIIISILIAIVGAVNPWSPDVSIVIANNETLISFPLISNLIQLNQL